MEKKQKKSILDFQNKQVLVFDDPFAFNLALSNEKAKKILDDIKQRGSPLFFMDAFDTL